MICEGTINNPCIAQINFTVKKSVTISPLGESSFNTDKQVKEIKVSNGTDYINFSQKIKFKKRQNISWTFYGYKFNPTDEIKWSFGEIDPVWKGVKQKEVIIPYKAEME